jgi:membrane-associated phospholipid phosphatase
VSILAAVAIALHTGPNPVDHAGFSFIPRDADSSILIWISKLGRPLILVLGTLTAVLVAARRDRARALACLGGPFLANLLVELAFKPLVGRRFEDVLSFPSGNVADVAAVATAWVLAVPRRGRPLAVLVGVVATGAMTVAVVDLRWHYPTDALVGAAFGVGMVLMVDGVVHLPEMRRWLPTWLRSDRPSAPPPGAPREDSRGTAPHQK